MNRFESSQVRRSGSSVVVVVVVVVMDGTGDDRFWCWHHTTAMAFSTHVVLTRQTRVTQTTSARATTIAHPAARIRSRRMIRLNQTRTTSTIHNGGQRFRWHLLCFFRCFFLLFDQLLLTLLLLLLLTLLLLMPMIVTTMIMNTRCCWWRSFILRRFVLLHFFLRRYFAFAAQIVFARAAVQPLAHWLKAAATITNVTTRITSFTTTTIIIRNRN